MNIITTAIAKRHKLSDADAAKVKVYETTAAASVDEADPYLFTARVTTDSVDRQGEVVVPQGCQLAEFLSTGGLFYNHQYDAPVGFPNKLKQIVKGERSIDIGFQFMRKPMDWGGSEFPPDFARAYVAQGVAAGMMPGVSIGFLPIESRNATKADRVKYGDGVEVVHSRWKLLEVSIAPVQANQDAGVLVVGKGIAAPTKRVVHITMRMKSATTGRMLQDLTETALLKEFGQVIRH